MNNKTDLGENLIFIISQPRAGSTLLQRILGSHPEIHTVAEPWIMLHPIYALKKESVTAEYEPSLANQALVDFLKHAPEGRQLYIKAIREMAAVLYGRLLELSGKSFFLDKTPRYYFIISELYEIFPQAKYIFLLRNPLAVLSSVLKTWFYNSPQILRNSYNYKDVMEAPNHLVKGTQKIGEKAIIIHYEELVLNPESVIRKLCDRLGIHFFNNMIQYGLYPAPAGALGDSTNIYQHQEPVSDYLNSWKSNLFQSKELLVFARQYLGYLGPDTVQSIGYSYPDLETEILAASLEFIEP